MAASRKWASASSEPATEEGESAVPCLLRPDGVVLGGGDEAGPTGADNSAVPESRVPNFVTNEIRGTSREIAAKPAPTKLAPKTGGNALVAKPTQWRVMMMNSRSTGPDSADATSTSAGPQTSPVPVSSHDDQNPLWLITAAMVIFFIAAAAILAAG